jgi:hypothetical protein
VEEDMIKSAYANFRWMEMEINKKPTKITSPIEICNN